MNDPSLICPLCGGAHSTLFDWRSFERSKTKHQIVNRLCSACGLVYQSPRMSAKELAAFYEQEYRQLYQGSEGPNARDLAVQRGRAEALLAFFQPQRALSQPQPDGVARHLDIGCSAGLLLERFQRAYNCQAVGVEPGRAYREYARAQGLTVYPSLEDLKKNDAGRFDLVSLAHVLEHLPDPVRYLADVRQELLTGQGLLLLEVPNLYAHDCFEVAHLVSYSPHTLAEVLRAAGFEILALQRHGQPRSALIPLYLTVLTRPVANTAPFGIRPERGVRLKRRLGLFHRTLLSRLLPRQAWLPVATGAK